MNFYSFHIGDYASATRHLSWEEDLAYRRLIDTYYMREGPLPVDRKQVYRLVVASSKAHRAAVDSVLEEFFTLCEEGYVNARCDEEVGKASEKRQKAKASAQISVQVRSAKAIRADRMEAARDKGKHSKTEWLALVEVCGKRCVKCGAEGHIDKDHIKPVYQGGSDGIENLQPLCARCNASKGPEDVDYRPTNWERMLDDLLSERSAFVQRSLSEGLAPNPNPNPNSRGDRLAREHDADLEAKLRNAAGWTNHPAPKLAITGCIQALLDSGADLDLDVLPVIRALAPKVRSPGWTYFVNPIAEARDQRISAATVVSLPTSSSRSTSHAAHRQKPSRDETFAAIDRRIAELAEAERRAAGGSQVGFVGPDEGAA